MKKEILFVIPEYSHGGTNKSLENLLSLLDKDKYNIHIYSIHEDGGKYYKEVFKDYILKKSLTYRFSHDNYLTRKIANLYKKYAGWKDWRKLYRREALLLQKNNRFDTVVAFQEGAATYFASYFSKEVRKIAWIHCDYKDWANKRQQEKDKRTYELYDKIVCVSETARESFCIVFPEYEDKSTFVYNTLDSETIKRMSNQDSPTPNLDKDYFNIISVGRLSYVKQFHIIPWIINAMGNEISNRIRWYIIGSGVQEKRISKEIEKYGLENVVVMLGQKDNPYPYIKRSDLYVCTSRSESYSYTIFESKILHTPVMSNSFPVAYEVLEKNCGWVCSIDEMPALLSDLINDKEGIYSRVKKSIEGFEYGNKSIIQQIETLL